MYPGPHADEYSRGIVPPYDREQADTSEQIYISSLALIKMLKHGRAGVPMEVMGLMLGELVDDYTVKVVDVFAMPQSGTGVSVEAVDPVFQTRMLDMLRQVDRPEIVVGWYHSHPGFGCWLSGTDINTQQSFEALNHRAVAVVIDPVQSVRGKVVIDAFRLINNQMMMLAQEPRQTTSNIGNLNRHTIQALIHGLNRHYYSIGINYRKKELEELMLLNLSSKAWTDDLALKPFQAHEPSNEKALDEIRTLSERYGKTAAEELQQMEAGESMESRAVAAVGKLDPRKRLGASVVDLMASNILLSMGSMLNSIVF
mmetsp:Transcript_29474/g.54109  ORF Transcript_29474/g.54109 Transcript_29474/m.54109 type:complete len:313 (-) Transcript_29474:375-1313(-)|eukprot:CAMPEP_0175054494 /NCGR_PEP_ID=MMETSP0052_2-20121109/9537_1 /TAXON_ID=51329 ORGANISM="Polytomella parva, Strain SAG 63-3" /NCGR_SAMPLE_ID=MMETSP0052_2 /ASSEMBLY_ACC=CAM_ASM_000194 /LENGTH=312 /DNA_ID=CAMNT_0016319197 /DNA_START=304 /DNA_END=1242 /DNA_ORIENTATION=-